MKILKNNWELLLLSLTILFIELWAIRTISTEIRIFAFLSNLLLLSAFIGIGIGMIIKRQIPLLTSAFFVLISSLVSIAAFEVNTPTKNYRFFGQITEMLAPLSEPQKLTAPGNYLNLEVLAGFLLLSVIFLSVLIIFIPLGQRLGIILSTHKQPLLGYSFNLIASVIGLWAFQLFSISYISPHLAPILIFSALILLSRDKTERIAISLVLLIFLAVVLPKNGTETKTTYWSPYHKIVMSQVEKANTNLPQPDGYFMEVNNAAYMSLLDLSDGYKKVAEEQLAKESKQDQAHPKYSDIYFLPFHFKTEPQEVMIIGAGAGNDIAAANRKNNELNLAGKQKMTIDAVEIDPLMYRIGDKYHPENPHDNQNVNTIVADGRSYLETTGKKYDMVIMGIADSYTPTSSLTNLRLDHYLYTRESFQKIHDVLKEDGLLFISFEIRRPWVGERLKQGLSETFGHEPLIFEARSSNVYGWGGYAFIASKNKHALDKMLSENSELSSYIEQNKRSFSQSSKLLTDNWPYLYLNKPRIPLLHVFVSALILVGLFLFKSTVLTKSRIHWPMFLWGAAFLLFEFQNVSKSSLLFGVTWVTNLFTISAILILLLLSNLTVQKNLIKPQIAFAMLIITAVVQLLIPLTALNNLSDWQKIIFASLILNLPLYFGGIIFADMFKKARDKANAFGSNFLGSVFGGCLEMASFLFGMHSLLFFVIALYSAGYFAFRKLKN